LLFAGVAGEHQESLISKIRTADSGKATARVAATEASDHHGPAGLVMT